MAIASWVLTCQGCKTCAFMTTGLSVPPLRDVHRRRRRANQTRRVFNRRLRTAYAPSPQRAFRGRFLARQDRDNLLGLPRPGRAEGLGEREGRMSHHDPLTHVSEKAKNAVVLLVPDMSRGIGLPTPRTPLTRTSARCPGMNNDAM